VQGNLNDLLKELPPDMARMVARYGVRLAIDLLQTFYNDLEGEGKKPERSESKKKLGRPPKNRPKGKQSGWSDDPEERRREMARRVEVSAAKLRKESRAKAAKKRWANRSAAERETWLRKMQRGKKKAKANNKQPLVHLAVAS
jgi:hypothetical protein